MTTTDVQPHMEGTANTPASDRNADADADDPMSVTYPELSVRGFAIGTIFDDHAAVSYCSTMNSSKASGVPSIGPSKERIDNERALLLRMDSVVLVMLLAGAGGTTTHESAPQVSQSHRIGQALGPVTPVTLGVMEVVVVVAVTLQPVTMAVVELHSQVVAVAAVPVCVKEQVANRSVAVWVLVQAGTVVVSAVAEALMLHPEMMWVAVEHDVLKLSVPVPFMV